MSLLKIKALFASPADYYGKTVRVGAWVRSIRASKTFGFIVLSDGSCQKTLQVVYDENVDDSGEMEIFDPEATWKKKTVYNFTAKELQVPIFQNGKLVYKCPDLQTIRSYCAQQIDTLWDEVKRFDNPHTYYVDLSSKLWDIKYRLLKENGGK